MIRLKIGWTRASSILFLKFSEEAWPLLNKRRNLVINDKMKNEVVINGWDEAIHAEIIEWCS